MHGAPVHDRDDGSVLHREQSPPGDDDARMGPPRFDALANKDFRYLTKTYLPRKLKARDWLD